jgi:GH24 family phage-related lysozyme (muramidase)
MFPISKFLEMITRHEADRLDVYADSLGIWTTGRGFNMEQSDARSVCRTCAIDYDAAMALKGTKQPAITEAQSASLFDHTVSQLLPEVRRLISSFDALSENRQLALADVAWVGLGTLKGFHQMLAAIHRGDWESAATQLLNSHLAEQWGHRAVEDADLLKLG